MLELLRVGDRVDRLDLVVGDVQRHHRDRVTVAVLEHAARLAVDRDLAHPDHAELPADARSPEQKVRYRQLVMEYEARRQAKRQAREAP